MVVGDMVIRAWSLPRGVDGCVSVVTILHGSDGEGSAIESQHEWAEPLFATEAEAVQFAWRRATLMAKSLTEPSS